jgi:hypothetical protein
LNAAINAKRHGTFTIRAVIVIAPNVKAAPKTNGSQRVNVNA